MPRVSEAPGHRQRWQESMEQRQLGPGPVLGAAALCVAACESAFAPEPGLCGRAVNSPSSAAALPEVVEPLQGRRRSSIARGPIYRDFPRLWALPMS